MPAHGPIVLPKMSWTERDELDSMLREKDFCRQFRAVMLLLYARFHDMSYVCTVRVRQYMY